MVRRAAKAAAVAARKATDVQARYDAGGSGRRIAGWNPPSSGPQRATENLQKIRNRARDAGRNDWAGASATQKWTTNLVGFGITPRWKNEKFSKLWAKHVPHMDADGILDGYGLQTLGVRSWFDGGEVFLRKRPRSLDLDIPAPVQFQLVEAEFVPMLDAEVYVGLPAGNTIRQGVERNKYGRRIALWMYREHPGDSMSSPRADQLVRVPISEVRQMFEPARPGQLRGVSGLSAVLVRLRASGDFEDAVLDRQKLANLFVSFITRQLPSENDGEVEYDSDTGLPKWYDKNGTPMVGLEPGTQQELQPGEDVKFSNPPEAGTTFSDYMRTTHLGTAAGTGLPYEVMSGDIKDISDRALRVIINEFRRFARQRQYQIVIPMLCQPMVEWWADALALKGAITLGELAEAKAPTWSPEGWEYLHPTQDAEGKKILIDAGLTSRERVVAERGEDVRDIDRERSEDKKRADKLGISPPDELEIAKAGAKPAPAASPAPAPAPKPKPKAGEPTDDFQMREAPDMNAQEFFVATLMAPMVTQLAASHKMLGESNKLMAEMATRPLGEVHVTVDPTPVAVNVAPTAIENIINVAPAPVNVAPPTIENIVNVAPATVDVSVSLPDRKIVSDIDRDRDGGIVKVTQIETTLKK